MTLLHCLDEQLLLFHALHVDFSIDSCPTFMATYLNLILSNVCIENNPNQGVASCLERLVFLEKAAAQMYTSWVVFFLEFSGSDSGLFILRTKYSNRTLTV